MAEVEYISKVYRLTNTHERRPDKPVTRTLSITIMTLICTQIWGCDEAAFVGEHAPPRDEPVARRYLDLLLQGEVDQIQPNLDSNIVDLDPRAKLSEVSDALPVEAPRSIKVVGTQRTVEGETARSTITYECEFSEERWYVVDISVKQKKDASSVVGMRVVRLSDSLENTNRFSLVDKGLSQFLGSGSLAFTFYVCSLCIRSVNGMKRWMWISFILAGVRRLAVNWTTGELHFDVLAIQLPCAAVTKTPYGPWMIFVYAPLGAFLFLNERWRKKVVGKSVDDILPVG